MSEIEKSRYRPCPWVGHDIDPSATDCPLCRFRAPNTVAVAVLRSVGGCLTAPEQNAHSKTKEK